MGLHIVLLMWCQWSFIPEAICRQRQVLCQ